MYMEKQKTKNNKSILQNNTGGQLSDLKTYYKATEMMSFGSK